VRKGRRPNGKATTRTIAAATAEEIPLSSHAWPQKSGYRGEIAVSGLTLRGQLLDKSCGTGA